MEQCQPTTRRLNIKKGRAAERYVLELMTSRSWIVLAQNYQKRACELDIVALKGETLAFVEVKYRRSSKQCSLDIATILPPRKINALQMGAQHFLGDPILEQYRFTTLRFDLALVTDKHHHYRQQCGKNGSTVLNHMDAIVVYYPGVFEAT